MIGRDLDKNTNTIDLNTCDVVPVEQHVDDKSTATLEESPPITIEDKGKVESEKDKGTEDYNKKTIIENKEPVQDKDLSKPQDNVQVNTGDKPPEGGGGTVSME